MSVIVKGMGMPQDCNSCILSNGYGWVLCRVKGHFWDIDQGQQKRPDWCPLAPMPEKHGRLIDAKALDYAFTDLRFNDDGSLRHWDARKNWCLRGSEVESLIENAETIVESEGE